MIRRTAILALFLLTAAAQDDPIKQAKKLLKDAGHEDGKGLPEFTIIHNTSQSHAVVAKLIRESWKLKLGVEAGVQNVEWRVYLDRLTKKDYDIARRGWIGDNLDPISFLGMFTTGNGNNHTGWSNKEYDGLIKMARDEADPKKRRALLEKAEKLIIDEAVIIPIYFYVNHALVNPNVKGWHPNPESIHPLRDVVGGDGDNTLFIQDFGARNLDPAHMTGLPEQRAALAIFEGLTRYDPKGGAPLPGAAKSWDVSKDGKTYTFHLRDAKWSNGDPVTAGDFEYSWKRILDPEQQSTYAFALSNIRGAEDFNKGKTRDWSDVGIRATDDKTLVIHLTHPSPQFLRQCAFMTLSPVHKATVEKHGKNWTDPKNIVTNGPFILTSMTGNGTVTVEKNKAYWDAAEVKQKKIQLKSIRDPARALEMYEDGELDVLNNFLASEIKAVRERKDYHNSIMFGTYFYSFNVTRKPFDDKRVRKALALAIDRKDLCEKAPGAQKPAYHLVPPVFPGFKHPRMPGK